CQAGGAISLFPNAGTTCGTRLHVGDFVNVSIRLINTCSTLVCAGGSNNGVNCTDDSECPGGVCGANVAATLRDACVGGANAGAPCGVGSECPGGICGAAIEYTLACTDTTCAVTLPGTLTFVPQGGNGCVSNAAGVASCAQNGGDPNLVDIKVSAGGVTLAAGTTTSIA